MWRSGSVSESKSKSVGSLPGWCSFWDFAAVSKKFYIFKTTICWRSSMVILYKFRRGECVYSEEVRIVEQLSSGMSETFFNTCVNWSCVTRCGCRTTSSTLFTVYFVRVQYTVKKVSRFPFPSRDVTNQTLQGREYLNNSRPGRVWLVTSRMGKG